VFSMRGRGPGDRMVPVLDESLAEESLYRMDEWNDCPIEEYSGGWVIDQSGSYE